MKKILLNIGIILGVCALLITITVMLGKSTEKKDKEEEITAEKIRKMSDKEFYAMDDDEKETLSKSAQKAYDKRMDDEIDKELKEYEESGQYAKDKAEREAEEQQDKEAEQREQQVADELRPIIKEDIYENDFGDVFSDPKVTGVSENGKSIIEVETTCNKNGKQGIMLGLKRTDVELHIQAALSSLYRNDVPKNFDEIRVKSTIYNWHEKGDEYEATTSETQKQADDVFYEPKVKIEKIQ